MIASHCNRCLPLGLVIALALCMFPSAHAATMTVGDTVMSSVNWTEGYVTNGPAGQSSTQQITGGSGGDGPYRETVHTVPGGYTFLNVYHILNSFTYNPATQGDILSLDFSIDYKTDGSTVGQGFVVAQGSKEWYGSYIAIASGGQWLNRGSSGPLTALDFQGYFDVAPPDFSANGAPITFGYNTANSSTLYGYSTTSGFDNFNVTIIHDPSTALVPEPAMISMLALSAIGLARRRR